MTEREAHHVVESALRQAELELNAFSFVPLTPDVTVNIDGEPFHFREGMIGIIYNAKVGATDRHFRSHVVQLGQGAPIELLEKLAREYALFAQLKLAALGDTPLTGTNEPVELRGFLDLGSTLGFLDSDVYLK